MDRLGRICGHTDILRRSPGAVAMLVAAAAALAGAPREAAGQCYYTYEEIPNPPGWQCRARAINELGWVAGYAENFGENYRAFIWRPETGTELLPLPAGYNSQRGFGINDMGHVAGDVGGPAGAAAFLWDGATTTLIHHPPWANGIDAYGVNNQGQVVGVIRNNLTGPSHAFVWQAGSLVDLTPNADNAVARAINHQGVIAGTLGASTAVRAFVINESGVHELHQPEPLVASEGLALNNNGFVVGIVLPIADALDPNFRKLGAVWDGNLRDIVDPPPGSRDAFIRGVNDAGRAVGGYERRSGAFVWQAGITQDLRPLVENPPSLLSSAWGINNSGQIAVRAATASGRLTPVWKTGDLTGDCNVAIDDLIILLSNFGSPQGTFPRGDVDHDGDVDISDLTLLLSNWGI